MYRILLVEDERKTAEALQQGLEDDGYSVEIAHTGEDGFFRLNSGEFDMAILDVMLPGRTGVEVLFTARKTGLRIPVLLLTAKDAIEDSGSRTRCRGRRLPCEAVCICGVVGPRAGFVAAREWDFLDKSTIPRSSDESHHARRNSKLPVH